LNMVDGGHASLHSKPLNELGQNLHQNQFNQSKHEIT
jgi:hypothetical protein